MKDEFLSQEDSKPHLEPLRPDLLASFWDAWNWVNDWKTADPRSRLILNSSTAASILSDAFGYFAFPRLSARRDTRSRNIGRSRLAVVGEEILLRFKKFTPDLHSMNIQTDQQLDIMHHQEKLPNGRRLTTITLGYTQNSLGSEVTGIYFACPNGATKNHWVWPIYQADDGQLGMFDAENPPGDSDGDVSEILNVDIRIKKRKGKHG